MMRNIFRIAIGGIGVLLCLSETGLAVDDGFSAERRISGKHLAIYCESGVEISGLANILNISASDKLLAGKKTDVSISPEGELTEMVDTLFIRSCDILDMQLFSFTGTLKICRSQSRLADIYTILFNRTLKDRASFYVYSLNTIYISADNFKANILGHEIAHAIISYYFVVLPSVKIQEVLASYVEYQLNKRSGI